jgi:hypothetical protein
MKKKNHVLINLMINFIRGTFYWSNMENEVIYINFDKLFSVEILNYDWSKLKSLEISI